MARPDFPNSKCRGSLWSGGFQGGTTPSSCCVQPFEYFLRGPQWVRFASPQLTTTAPAPTVFIALSSLCHIMSDRSMAGVRAKVPSSLVHCTRSAVACRAVGVQTFGLAHALVPGRPACRAVPLLRVRGPSRKEGGGGGCWQGCGAEGQGVRSHWKQRELCRPPTVDHQYPAMNRPAAVNRQPAAVVPLGDTSWHLWTVAGACCRPPYDRGAGGKLLQRGGGGSYEPSYGHGALLSGHYGGRWSAWDYMGPTWGPKSNKKRKKENGIFGISATSGVRKVIVCPPLLIEKEGCKIFFSKTQPKSRPLPGEPLSSPPPPTHRAIPPGKPIHKSVPGGSHPSISVLLSLWCPVLRRSFGIACSPPSLSGCSVFTWTPRGPPPANV